MELLDVFLGDWLTALSAELDAGVDARRGSEVRARQLADVLAGSLAGRGVLCDLFGAQGGVLEHDVSVEVVTRHKRASLARLTTATDLVRRHVPELGDGAQSFCLMSLVTARALASYVPPPSSRPTPRTPLSACSTSISAMPCGTRSRPRSSERCRAPESSPAPHVGPSRRGSRTPPARSAGGGHSLREVARARPGQLARCHGPSGDRHQQGQGRPVHLGPAAP